MKYGYSDFWLEKEPVSNINKYGEFLDRSSSSIADLMDLAKYRRAIGNFVRIATGKDIKVNFSSGDQSYTDGNEVVISAKIDDKTFDSTVGLALHEGSHILLTDFKMLDISRTTLSSAIPALRLGEAGLCQYNKDSLIRRLLKPVLVKLNYDYKESGKVTRNYVADEIISKLVHAYDTHFFNILNFVEDRRIDHFMYVNAPGYRGYYNALYDRYFNSKRIDKALQSSSYRECTWDDYMFRLINITNKNRDLDALPGLRQIWKMLDLKTIDRIETFDEVHELSIMILLEIKAC